MADSRSLTPAPDADYEAIEAAVMETSRGRWFLAEFARRNRTADTLALLDAISRLEGIVKAEHLPIRAGGPPSGSSGGTAAKDTAWIRAEPEGPAEPGAEEFLFIADPGPSRAPAAAEMPSQPDGEVTSSPAEAEPKKQASWRKRLFRST